jgi:ComF family protein
MLRVAASGLLDLLSPPSCPACDLPRWPWSGEVRFCDACALLVDHVSPELRPPQPYAAVVLYQGPMADAIRNFKYRPDSSLARPLSEWLTDAALAYAGEIDAVVPMPLHPTKLRQRGWNPAVLLARPVARTLGVPLRTRWLQRTRATAVQAGLSREARQRNVFGAFRARTQQPPARVLLIDDVRTTGATLHEAARCLEACGHSVSTLALAWANDSDPA